jgi:hypothetical protein
MLEIPLGTVRSRLARGRSLLQESLWEHHGHERARRPDPLVEAEAEPALEDSLSRGER